MKPTPLVADEMFPEGVGRFTFEIGTENMEESPGGSGAIMIDITGDEKTVHADFFNDFDDLYDDEDLD